MATLKKCLGVDLGSHTVKVVELAIDRNGVRVLTAASAETDADPSAPVEERRDAIVKALRGLLKRSKISTRDAIFGMPGQKVFIRRFRLPETTPERLERIIRYEARQQIPFPPDKTDLQFEFFPIPEEKEVEVLLVAVRHDEVKEFMAIVDKCGLKPRAIGVSSFAVFNGQSFLNRSKAQVTEMIAGLKTRGRKQAAPSAKPAKTSGKKKKPLLALSLGKKKGAAAEVDETEDVETQEEVEQDFAYEEVRGYVNIGGAATDLVIAQHGKKALLKFSRSFPPGGNEVTRAIRQALNVSSFLDAERIKKHQSRLMTFDFDMMDEESNVNREASAAATQAVDRIVSEIRRSLDFFISQPDGMAVDTVMLSGGLGEMEGMVPYLEEKLTIPVSKLDQLPDNTGLIWSAREDSISPLIPALGLAVQGLGLGDVAVDFLPEERKITRDFPYRTVFTLLALLIGVVYFASQSGQKYIEVYRAEAANLRQVVQREQGQRTLEQDAQRHHDELAAKYETLSRGFQDRNYWVEFLAKMEEARPPEVQIGRVTGEHDGTIRIVGISESRRSAADFSRGLREVLVDPKETPQVETIRDDVPGEQWGRQEPRVIQFTIKLKAGDKYNMMRVTPTPAPDALLGPGRVPGQPTGRPAPPAAFF